MDNDPPSPTPPSQMPAMPLTLEGACLLHQMFRIRWGSWRKLVRSQRIAIMDQAFALFTPPESEGKTALYSLLGHKGDLLLIHFRDTFDDLNRAELQINHLDLAEFLEPTHSYLSVVELGLYDSTAKLYQTLADRGLQPHTPEWSREVDEVLARQRDAMQPRLYPQVPGARYLSFYPMDRRRGEHKNWYTLPLEERRRQMEEHGLIGRRYAGKVQQIISGSIGFDDWEWAVDLFAADPLVFKRLIYEMRFDQVSADYAIFGSFYLGIRCPMSQMGELLDGKLPGGI